MIVIICKTIHLDVICRYGCRLVFSCVMFEDKVGANVSERGYLKMCGHQVGFVFYYYCNLQLYYHSPKQYMFSKYLE